MTSISPLPDALYVAQGSPAGGDGSIAKPFNTMADALAALAGLGVGFGCLLMSPGDYSGEGVLHWTGAGALMLKGYSGGVPFPDPFAAPNPQVQLPSITADTGFPDLYLDNVTSALTQQFNNFTNISGVGCELQTVLTGGNLWLRDSRMVSSMNVGGDVRLWNCEVSNDSDWHVSGSSVELVGTKIISFGAANIVFDAGPGVVTLDDFSNFYFVALGIPITNGTKTVAADASPTGQMLATAATNTFDTSPALNVFAAAVGAAWTYAGTTEFTRAGGVLTYAGTVKRTYAVRANGSLHIAAANAVLGFGISVNADLNGVAVGAAAELASGAQYSNQVTSGGTVGIACERIVTLNPGDTLQLVGATATGAVDITIDRASLVVVAA